MINASTRISDIIYKDVQLISVLYCFGVKEGIAEKTAREVCSENYIDLNFFISIFNTYSEENYFPNVNEININLLIDYLKSTHKYYLGFTIPRINKLFSALSKRHPNNRKVRHIKKYFNEYIHELKKHIEFEEKILFPMILEMIRNPVNRKRVTEKSFKRLKSEHANVEDKLSDLKTILLRYLPSKADKQLSFDVLTSIDLFEKNHLSHARFEDRILIPKMKGLLKTG